ncbi:proton-conducting membrane transporter [Halolamina salina]|uniref:Proton-conducting membrane transporter n=1 Tax=Halolamina salina TaxID=1220023 RepID=A0ABD6B9G7_9EURY
MVTRPELKEDGNYANGLAAAVLFVVLAAVFLTSNFGEAAGFAEDASLVAGIGYALMDLQTMSAVAVEGFLAAFEIIGLVLVVATVAAVTLARRQSDGSYVTALTDGGRKASDSEEPRSSERDEEVAD